MESGGSQHVECKGYSVYFAQEAGPVFAVVCPRCLTGACRVSELTSVQRCDQAFRLLAVLTAGARHAESYFLHCRRIFD
jgi:hypothetical protein